MSDIIRMARAMYGPAYDEMANEASAIKNEYVQAGGDPLHVYSPERVDALMAGGPDALMAEPTMTRDDGSIAGPYVPPDMALATNMIEPRAVPAVLSALQDGIHTVSSGYDEGLGVGYAIGRTPEGRVVRVQK
jgi:hypothetical protein